MPLLSLPPSPLVVGGVAVTHKWKCRGCAGITLIVAVLSVHYLGYGALPLAIILSAMSGLWAKEGQSLKSLPSTSSESD